MCGQAAARSGACHHWSCQLTFRAYVAGSELMPHPYAAYEETRLWRAVAAVFADLQATEEVRVDTAPEYVIGYFCRELEAKGIVTAEALTAR